MRMRWLLPLGAAVAASAALVGASVAGATVTRATSFAPVSTPTNVNAWIGLKNSDDVGTSFDLKAEVTAGSDFFQSTGYGFAYNVPGGSSG